MTAASKGFGEKVSSKQKRATVSKVRLLLVLDGVLAAEELVLPPMTVRIQYCRNLERQVPHSSPKVFLQKNGFGSATQTLRKYPRR